MEYLKDSKLPTNIIEEIERLMNNKLDVKKYFIIKKTDDKLEVFTESNQCTVIYNYIDEVYNSFKDVNDYKHYVIIYAGMGCCIYAINLPGFIKCFFMHSDSWGQYGPESDDTPYINALIEGREEKK